MKLSFPIYRLKRQAKLLARGQSIPLHLALDQTARAEGFRSWAHLASSQSQDVSFKTLLAACQPGEVVLIAARPGHGKTRLALDLLSAAATANRHAYFFTLEYIHDDLRPAEEKGIHIDTSDEICADYIVARIQHAPAGSIAAIDYLQLLDQRRDLPPLAAQVEALSGFAEDRRITLLILSQIDRRFDSSSARLPGFGDLRLPNPVNLGNIAKGFFLHDGQGRLERPMV